jgi:VanZ family protein
MLGFVIEIIQLFLPYRSFEAGDLLVNGAGSFLGCLFKIS